MAKTRKTKISDWDSQHEDGTNLTNIGVSNARDADALRAATIDTEKNMPRLQGLSQ